MNIIYIHIIYEIISIVFKQQAHRLNKTCLIKVKLLFFYLIHLLK